MILIFFLILILIILTRWLADHCPRDSAHLAICGMSGRSRGRGASAILARAGQAKGSLMRRWHRALAAATTSCVAVAGGMAAAEGRPYEHLAFEDQGAFVTNFCGDPGIKVKFRDWGTVVGRVTGPQQTLRYTVTHHVRSTWTNQVTKRAMTFQVSVLEQDLRVTEADGRLTILHHTVINERAWGPDGKLAYVEPGVTTWRIVLDGHGTIDPEDDTFISETMLVHHGGKPGLQRDFCRDFQALTR